MEVFDWSDARTEPIGYSVRLVEDSSIPSKVTLSCIRMFVVNSSIRWGCWWSPAKRRNVPSRIQQGSLSFQRNVTGNDGRFAGNLIDLPRMMPRSVLQYRNQRPG